ncbi:hypothetical protein GIB67_016996 [Kingdonia uniflora]|uniref:S1 motif domain-containing protein n=1 Tax=Kingdonia uniflora TaxID=39325 RepID=A0A7J7M3W2_9MAGN|nr:hypothetical protein GIB67_016996 [Kingdonia uniflora]
MGRTVVSDEEDDIIGEDEEDREPRDAEDIEDRDEDDDDEEDEEDGQDEYEKDGFIVDDADEEDQDDAGEEKPKKKKRKKRESEKNYVLDEDDYELLQDNNVGFHRPKPKAGRDYEQEEQIGFSDEEPDKGNRSRRPGEEKGRIFEGEGGSHYEDGEEELGHPEDEFEDEMRDFIVEEDEVDENGAPVRNRKPNRKKSRQAPGVSSSALQEAHDIFGDVDELLILRKQGLSSRHDDMGERGPKRLEDEFEPFILQEKFMTEKDEEIRETDIPERMQIVEESTGPAPADEMSLEEESAWIHDQLLSTMLHLFGKEELNEDDLNERTELSENIKHDISNLLELMHVEKFDIPFIAMYRKESFPGLLKYFEEMKIERKEEGPIAGGTDEEDAPKLKWHKVLWAIKDLDKKWLLLQKRKIALQSYYGKRYQEESQRIDDLTRLNVNQRLYESIIESLKTAESEREVDDVDSKFNLHFPPGEVGAQEGQFKRPKRKSKYIDCKNAGLWEVASKIGYNSEQFGLLINFENTEEFVDDKDDPETIATNFTCQDFSTSLDVLKGARHMAAVEISCEPRVRKHVRLIFMKDAVVSTNPTRDGNTAIDSFHEFAPVKWLSNKPLRMFKNADWLLIQKAEEEKLLQVTIELPLIDALIKQFSEYYLSDNVSNTAKLWNEQRELILNDAFFNFLLPLMKKEARSVLTVRAKNWLLTEYGKQLWRKVGVAPYKRKEADVGSDDEAAPRVMACCWAPGKPATTFVMLDSAGEIVDVIYTGSLSTKSQIIIDQQRVNNDLQRLMKFITDYQPQVVVLGAVNPKCDQLKKDIYETIFKLVEERPRDMGHHMGDVLVHYGDESLPRLYENSRISSDQLPGQPGIVRRAVALGRYLQNPLAMVATLCGPGREILSWKLSSLEHFLSPDEKYDMVEQVMVDVTNQVGLDINIVTSHEWLFAPLQYLSGLGPRKAASLQKSLVRHGVIISRKDLATYLKKKVFMNVVGFVRVRHSGTATNGSYLMDLLDDTRIHPESYELAKRMAKDVHDADTNFGNEDDEAQEMAIEYVRENPSYLKNLNIDGYAESIEEYNKKKETLRDIQMELLCGFRERRTPYSEFGPYEAFYMLCGETEDSLAQGRIVQATVRTVQASRVYVALECGLSGCISSDDYSDRGQIDSDELSVGNVLTCKIKHLQLDRNLLHLTCKESELKRTQFRNFERDPFYKPNEGSLQNEQEKSRKEKEKLLAKKSLQSRMIVHPRFQNITATEAKEFLSDKEEGESIIRPSIRGPNYLTLTLKVHDDVYADRDIIEGGKDRNNMNNLLKLGKTLKIGDDTFDDLDEVIDRYVDPLVANLKLMLNYRKFKKGSKAEVDEILRREKSENPSRIVYCFGVSHEYPGTFVLTFIRNTNPHHEYISWLPKGFKFRRRVFEGIDRLVNYFQKHINDMPPDAAPSIRSVAAMVPMRSPATGGNSGGASVGSGGWGVSTGNNGDDGWGGNLDPERSSTPGSRTGRNDHRNNSSGPHPSGLPRHDGGERGRGRGGGRGRDSYNDRGHNNYKDGGTDGWSSFPGAKVQNSPGREAFPGGWGNSFPGAKVQNSPGREAFPGGWSSGGSGGGGADSGADGGGWGGSNGGNDWGRGGGQSGGGSGDDGWGKSGAGGGNGRGNTGAGSADGGGNDWGSGGGVGQSDGEVKSSSNAGGGGWSGGRGDRGSGKRDRTDNGGRDGRTGGGGRGGWSGGGGRGGGRSGNDYGSGSGGGGSNGGGGGKGWGSDGGGEGSGWGSGGWDTVEKEGAAPNSGPDTEDNSGWGSSKKTESTESEKKNGRGDGKDSNSGDGGGSGWGASGW